jgi:hypothetical protein
MNKVTTSDGTFDMKHVQRCLGWKSFDVLEKTLKATTQLAQNHFRLPMRMHFKSRTPALNVRRLRETFATDTFFSSEKALGGFTMAQLYVGKTSTFTAIFGMKTESQMVETLQDFIRQWGAPSRLLTDSAKVETSKVVKDVLRMYGIKDMQSEANHQHQNYAERRVQEVKNTANIVMDRVNAPNHLWYLCLQYVVQVLNHLATPSLNNRTPIEKAFGVTPDLSGLLQFYFYQPVFYLDTNKPAFPKSKELLGHWVGLTENVGDALTYWILTTENQVIARSTLCPAYHPEHQNLCQAEGEDLETFRPPPGADARADVIHNEESIQALPTFDPMEVVGKRFIKEHNGFPHHAKVLEPMEDGTKFLVALGDGEREEIMTYHEIMDLVENQLDDDNESHAWAFETILDHRKKGRKYDILILWTTGEETWEDLSWIGAQDPITVAKYGQAHNLLNKPAWKRFKRMVGQEKQFIRMLKQANAAKIGKGPMMKFGIEVPKHFNDALRLDRVNGNNLWEEAIKTELEQINSCNTFTDYGKDSPPPKDFKKVPVHFGFDIKFDLRRKARLVAGGHLTKPIYNNAPYSGIASLKSIRTCIFLAELNGLSLCAADVGNAYLEAETKEKLFIIAGPEFGKLEGNTLIVHKALYGLRTSGARWAEHLADSLRAQGFRSSYADPAI